MTILLDTSSFATAAVELTRRDVDLARLVDTYGLPPFWSRPPGFRSLVLFILEQQVSLSSARATFARVEDGLGVISPERIAACPDEQLRTFGVTRQKTRYVRALAEAVQSGLVDLDALGSRSDHEVRSALTAVPGIGPWTAEVYLLSCLRRPDAWPTGDRALQTATAEALGLGSAPTAAELTLIGERWVPWRAVAARLLWHGYLSRRGRTEPAA